MIQTLQQKRTYTIQLPKSANPKDLDDDTDLATEKDLHYTITATMLILPK